MYYVHITQKFHKMERRNNRKLEMFLKIGCAGNDIPKKPNM